MEITNKSNALRALAQTIRDNPLHREAIADGFDLIADAMEPCEDCGRTSLGNEEEQSA